jgi:hypothetical protein
MTAANSRSLQFPVSMEFRHAKSTSTHDVTAFVFAFGEVLLCSIMTKCAMRTTVRGTVLKARPITSSKPFGEVIYYPCLKIVHCAGDLDNPIRLHFGRTGLSLRMSAIVISTSARRRQQTRGSSTSFRRRRSSPPPQGANFARNCGTGTGGFAASEDNAWQSTLYGQSSCPLRLMERPHQPAIYPASIEFSAQRVNSRVSEVYSSWIPPRRAAS